MTKEYIPKVGEECKYQSDTMIVSTTVKVKGFDDYFAWVIHESERNGKPFTVARKDLAPLKTEADTYRDEQIESMISDKESIGYTLGERLASKLFDSGFRLLKEGEFVAKELSYDELGELVQALIDHNFTISDLAEMIQKAMCRG